MTVHIECDFDVDTAVFSSKVLVFLFRGEIAEHTLPKWQLSSTDEYFAQFRYCYFSLTSLSDSNKIIRIGCNPKEAGGIIIKYHNVEIRKFLTRVAKRYGCRPGFPNWSPMKFHFSVGDQNIPFFRIKSKQTADLKR